MVTLDLRRMAHDLVAVAVIGALLAVSPAAQPAAEADPAKPTTPAITLGTNGDIAWTQLIRDPANGAVTGGYLRSSQGRSYSDLSDANVALRDPEWSPDGTRMAYWAFGATGSRDGIWVVAHPFANSGPKTQITTGEYDSNPAWSPDGTRIAFVRTQGGNGIYVVDAEGGTPVQILRSNFYGEDLTWSPDGTRIAYTNFSGTPFSSPKHIYVMDADGGTPVDLGVGQSPSWSPDGTKIAFEYPQTPSNFDVYWMNPDGTGRLLLLNAGYHEREPSWSPDGKRMAFLRSDGIYIYDWTTGGQSLVTSGTNFESTTWGAAQPVCQGRQVTIGGTSGNDTLSGSNGIDVIHGMAGNDTILGLQGQDIICGGSGIDTVSYAGQTAPVTAYLGETSALSGVSDLIAGDVENLVGGSGPDTLVGDHRVNQIDGGDGADDITSGGGADRVIGGRGDDLLVGGESDDQLFGSGGDDALIGDEGNDFLSGSGGDDVLRGGDGTDRLDGGFDGDLLTGGPGIDTADYAARAVGVTITVGGGGDDDGSREDGAVGERDRVRGSVENVDGGSGPDVLVGNEVANQLTGNLGVDELRGGDGRDLLRANDGVRDGVIDCGAGTDADALRDSVDPAAISCP